MKDTSKEPPKEEPKAKSKSKFHAETHETIEARHEFSQSELIDLADTLTKKMAAREALHLQRKAVAAEFASKIKAADSEVQEVGERFSNRSELRPVECRVEFNAKTRTKEYFEVLTGRKVKEAAMNEKDFQLWFPIEVKKPKTVVSAAFDKADQVKAEKEAKQAQAN